MDLKKLLADEQAHRSIPFWSWNDKLEEAEIRRQVNVMKKSNNGGFFMHARGGLQTEYLGEDWYRMISASIDEAKKTGLDAWAYDENGWPSGFADGRVPERGLDWQQKRITTCILGGRSAPEHTVAMFKLTDDGYERTEKAEKGVLAVYMSINKYYIDAFNPDCIKYFTEIVHDEYYKRFEEDFGKTLKGFFTDEPQFNSSLHMPWSHVFEEEFSKRYGYSLTDNLPALFGNYDTTFSVRYDYWRMVGELFRERFMKQLYDWCEEHNCKLTGHMMNESGLGQLFAVADAMPCYEYFHIPGVDWLGRDVSSPLTPKQLGSAARQLGRPTISESFALTGWDVSPNDLRLIAGWQYVNGVSMICQHLEAYTLRGLRKRDYPAALFMQLPWYDKAYSQLNLYLSRLGSMLDSAYEPATLLVIHPIFTAALIHEGDKRDSIKEYDDYINDFFDLLNDRHLMHHYGSEVMLERMGRVNGDRIAIGKCEYETVLIPRVKVLSSNTVDMLCEFAKNGGKLYAIEIPSLIDGRPDPRTQELEALAVILTEDELSKLHTADMPSLRGEKGDELARVHITERMVEDEKFFYLINLENDFKAGEFSTSGEYVLSEFDVMTEEKKPLACSFKNGKTCVVVNFAPGEAKVILAEKGESSVPAESEKEYITLNREFALTDASPNILTLDSCEYSIDGGEWQGELAVIRLFRKLLELRRPCKASLRFKFNADFVPEKLYLLCETPKQFKYTINGKQVNFEDIGYEIDSSFRKTDISEYVKLGENEIILDTDFYQSQVVYDVEFGVNVNETEKNKLTYDTEIESIYLFGDFGVRSSNEYTYGARRSIFTGHSFTLTERPKNIDIERITETAHPFFAGNITLSQKVTVKKREGVSHMLSLSALNAPCAELRVNGEYAGIFMFTPHEKDITRFLRDGENEIEFILYSGNRNMLGPHHRPIGEIYSVGPSTFTDIAGWADDPDEPTWTDNFSFVKFGIEL